MKKIKENGITLVALSVTVIVLLILVGVSVGTIRAGIIKSSKEKMEQYADDVDREIEKQGTATGYLEDKMLGNNLKDGVIDGSTPTPEPTPPEPEYVCEPKVTGDMIKVYWEDDFTEIREGDSRFDINKWYEYKEQSDGTENGGDSRWANIVLKKSSYEAYFTWIPRYEYKITSGYHSATTGTIDVRFIPVTQTTPSPGYTIHPAFTNNTEIGGWDKEISGIWVTKYITTIPITGSVQSVPNAIVKNTVSGSSLFNMCRNYNASLNSHLMKNSEWGCVAYLAHSQYGRDKTEPNANYAHDLISGTIYPITGWGGRDKNSDSTKRINSGEVYPYNSVRGVLASTTGNIHGIYDMVGCYPQTVSAYLEGGAGIFSSDKKYINIYKDFGVGSNSGYNYIESKVGDAIYETSARVSTYGITAWNGDQMSWLEDIYPAMRRGGNASGLEGTGMFALSKSVDTIGEYSSLGRICLIIEE